MTETFLDCIDFDRLGKAMENTQNNVKYFEEMTDSIVNSYTSSLDGIMKDIYKDIINIDYSPPLNVLERYFLELSNCIYFLGEKLEHLGIYNAMSKSAYKEVYNNSYLSHTIKDDDKKNKMTVAELTATAEKDAQYESVVNDVYDKAYSIVKSKLSSANIMISSLSKIISRRINEMNLSQTTPSGKQILNEELNTFHPTV